MVTPKVDPLTPFMDYMTAFQPWLDVQVSRKFIFFFFSGQAPGDSGWNSVRIDAGPSQRALPSASMRRLYHHRVGGTSIVLRDLYPTEFDKIHGLERAWARGWSLALWKPSRLGLVRRTAVLHYACGLKDSDFR